MGKVTESIYSSATTVIPLADVSHVLMLLGGIQVISKHTTYNFESDEFNNCAFIHRDEQAAFLSAWCRFRYELEYETLEDLALLPQPPQAERVPMRQPMTDPQISIAARTLSDRAADVCGVDRDDIWKTYGDEYIDDMRAALNAVSGIGVKP